MSESKVRMEKLKRNFSMIQNAPLRDKRLSLKARGLYAFMSSLPDNWTYTVSGLAVACNAGRTTIRNTLIELEEAGYLDRVQVRTEAGTFGAAEYVLYEYSRLDTPRQNPTTDEPTADEPVTEEGTLYNTDSSNTNPPVVPQKGDGAPKPKRKRRSPEWKEQPDWMPEMFEGFWKRYPAEGRKNRQAAIKAWDKLKPDKELLWIIRKSLDLLGTTARWKDGVGIPNASTFLNQHRWTDAESVQPLSGGGQAPEPPPESGWD